MNGIPQHHCKGKGLKSFSTSFVLGSGIAQWLRASDHGAQGWEFDSHYAFHEKSQPL